LGKRQVGGEKIPTNPVLLVDGTAAKGRAEPNNRPVKPLNG